MKSKLSILAIDDVPIFLEGLSAFLKSRLEDCEVRTAATFEEAKTLLNEHFFDLVFLDLELKNSRGASGFDVAYFLKEHYPDTGIIVITAFVKIDHIERLYEQDFVNAFIEKQVDPDDLFIAMEEVLKGNSFLPESIKKVVDRGKFYLMTNREREIINLLTKSLTKKEIAEHLFISVATVDTHVRSLFAKFNVNSTQGLCSKYVEYIGANSENPDDLAAFRKV